MAAPDTLHPIPQIHWLSPKLRAAPGRATRLKQAAFRPLHVSMESELGPRVILIDSDATTREVLTARLRTLGFRVEPVSDSATGAELALSAPPAAVVADLWMPSISGVQICRLLRSEPATSNVPVILRGEKDDPKSRFWSERAGAVCYVVKGKMGDLVRELQRAAANHTPEEGFFMEVGEALDIRDRIAAYLDAALFESVLAAEVRALASAGSFERLFDLFSQLLSRLSSYRWLAVSTREPAHFGVHHHPCLGEQAVAEARAALGLPATMNPVRVQDEDAVFSADTVPAIVCPIYFAGSLLGQIALSTAAASPSEAETTLLPLVAKELGSSIRMTVLVEESQRQATTDLLTGLSNRRAFLEMLRTEVARAERYNHPLSLLLLDIDHFKLINDQRGHASGDVVLSSIGSLLRRSLRQSDVGARWGGEEFVVALTDTPGEGAQVVAERLREQIEKAVIMDARGERVEVTASVGIAEFAIGEKVDVLIDRADRAMYGAKVAGRNRVVVDVKEPPVAPVAVGDTPSGVSSNGHPSALESGPASAPKPTAASQAS